MADIDNDNKDLNLDNGADGESKVEIPENKKEDKTNKTFNQEELNKIVQSRVQSEKAKAKELADNFDAEKKTLEDQLKGYETIIKTIVDGLKKDVPEQYKPLFDKLSLGEQYEFLNNPKNKTVEDRKAIPLTPKPADGNKTTDAPKKVNKWL
jgi:hypothetical protein